MRFIFPMQNLFLHWEGILYTEGMGIRMKKIIISVLMTVLVLMPVYAEINISDTDNLLNKSFILTDMGTEGVSGMVYLPDMTADNISFNGMTDLAPYTAYTFQKKGNELGVYNDVFNLDNHSTGEYTAVIYDIEHDVNYEKKFFFSNKDDYKTVADALKLKAKSEVEAFLDDVTLISGTKNSDILELDCYSAPYYTDKVKAEFARILGEYITDSKYEPLKNDNREFNRKKLHTMLAQARVTMNEANDFSEIAKESEIIVSGALKKYYELSFMTDAVKTDILNRLRGKSFTCISEYESKLIEAFVLEIVQHNDGYSHMKEIIYAFDDEIGITPTSYSNNQYFVVSGGSYADYSELISALNNAPKNTAAGNSGGGSGGGGSGGGAKANSSVPKLEMETDKENKTEEVTKQKLFFDDLGDVEWACEAIEYMAGKRIVEGKGDGRFYPNDHVSREEFVKMVVVLTELNQSGDIPKFEDVNEDDWYYKYVNIAYSNGIINGISDELFGAGDSITRQDIAVILNNLAQKGFITLEITKEAAVFTDKDNISDYALDAVNTLSAAGIINGFEDGRYMPESSATRAQAALMLYNILK